MQQDQITRSFAKIGLRSRRSDHCPRHSNTTRSSPASTLPSICACALRSWICIAPGELAIEALAPSEDGYGLSSAVTHGQQFVPTPATQLPSSIQPAPIEYQIGVYSVHMRNLRD